jgi:hypothetical protein
MTRGIVRSHGLADLPRGLPSFNRLALSIAPPLV